MYQKRWWGLARCAGEAFHYGERVHDGGGEGGGRGCPRQPRHEIRGQSHQEGLHKEGLHDSLSTGEKQGVSNPQKVPELTEFFLSSRSQ